MKKALGQTVRDLKREVNKKVLKVPSIEQKVLDATSNEPWGPHGSHLADIAQATRNYHEYQMIMSVIWKRVNDTGKNWRHVYKALTVLEYLVANGSERVIDEIREHAYQISTLSDFQYIDSSGRDQGSNVRKKSQSLVVLVNDKDRIQEVRQKAAANRDKFRNTSMGGMYKPGSYSGVGGYGERYDDDRSGSRDEDRNGYGRERDWDSNSRDGDRYGRDSEERYGRDGYRDDDSRGRSQSVDPYNYGSRSRSADRDRDRSYEDDGQFSSRGSAAKADDRSQDGSVAGRQLDRKYSEQNLGAPPSYEEAVVDARSPIHSERDGETSATSVPKSSSPPVTTSHQESTTSSTSVAPPPPPAPAPAPTPAPAPASENKEFDGFDEFDPRGSFKAAPTSSNSAEVDFLSDPYSLNSLAIVPTTTATATSESGAFTNSGSGNGFPLESTASNQPFEDPFGDGPFRAISSADSFPAQQQNVASMSSFHPSSNHSDPRQQTSPNTEAVDNFGFGDTDILADIFPPSGSSPTGFPAQTVHPSSQTGFQGQMGQPSSMTGYPEQAGQQAPQAGFQGQMNQPSSMTGYPEQAGQHAPQAGFPHPGGQHAPQAGFPHPGGQHASLTGFPSQMGTAQQAGFPAPSQPAQPGANFYGSFNQQQGSTAPVGQPTTQTPTGPPAQYNTMNFNPQSGSQMAPQIQQAGLSVHHRTSSLPASTNSLAIVPQPAKDKFETKSTVWADTLNRGLVNLNISGSKTNPLADIGVDFDAINRKEKRMEKPNQTPVVSTITMGKAMGSGSGIGRAGAGAIRGAPNPMMGSGFHMGVGGAPGGGMGHGPGMGMGMGMGGGPGAGMGMGGGPGAGMGMGGGYGVNQPMGGMGMRMNMGMGQGIQMQQPQTGFPPGSNMPGGYNPMMGTGNYGQQPYNGGYR